MVAGRTRKYMSKTDDAKKKSENFFLAGSKLMELKEYQKAKRKFDYALKYDDQNPYYYFFRAKALASLKKKDQYLRDMDKSITIYNREIREDPTNAEYHDGRAMALEMLGSESDIDIGRFQYLNIKPIPADEYESDADLVIRKFMSIFKEALEESDTAIKLDSGNVIYRMHRASMMRHLANELGSDYSCMLRGYFNRDELYNGAIEDCNHILEMDGNDKKALILKAEIFQDSKRDEEAVKVCDDLLKLDPYNTEVLYLKGYSLRWLKKYEEAMKQCDMILEREPENSDTHLMRGDILYWLERYEEAIKEFDTSMLLDPNDYYSHFLRGNALVNLNRYDEALIEYDIAIRIAPYKYSARSNKVVILRKMGRQEEADKEFSDTVNYNRCVLSKS
jgi:tetratricopeptide (TPR) repeat protein